MYNIRVYGLLIENDAVLVSDEFYKGLYMTKFPGGGHEIGESLIDCLHREFKDELDININIIKHFYTTDFYVPSFFIPKDQLISIYFLVNRVENAPIITSNKKFDFDPVHGAQSMRWLNINEMDETELTYPIDKKVVTMLKNSYYI
jgi:ADP-ribose pyrophosphatase YjhB (NUDIX family)